MNEALSTAQQRQLRKAVEDARSMLNEVLVNTNNWENVELPYSLARRRWKQLERASRNLKGGQS